MPSALAPELAATLKAALAEPNGYVAFLRRLGEAFGTSSGTLHQLGSDGLLHLVAHTQIPVSVLERIQSIRAGKGMAGLALQRAEPVSICNLQTDRSGQARPKARATGMAGSIAVPVFDGSRVVGVLGVAQESEREFSDPEIAFLLAAARLLAQSQAWKQSPTAE